MLTVGAVSYHPRVVTIWERFREYFADAGVPTDYVLYSNYEHQVEDLVAGTVDVAWNSPLAWVRTRRLAIASGGQGRALAMRDSDRDLTSVVVVREGSGIDGIADLKGKVVGAGAVDSPQATLLPLDHLGRFGVGSREVTVRRFEVGVGLHGDHVGGERDAARALVAGEVDAACMIDGNHLLFGQEGTLPPGSTRVLAQTPVYDHCTMAIVDTAPAAEAAEFVRLLGSMSYADPEVRPLLDLEGLKQWVPGRTSGFGPLTRAVDETGFYDAAGAVTAAEYRP